MKRSEMLLLINNFLRMSTNEINDLSYDSYEQITEDLLYLIESDGMLPPQALFKPSKIGSCLCTMRESCSSCGGYCNEWEPENV